MAQKYKLILDDLDKFSNELGEDFEEDNYSDAQEVIQAVGKFIQRLQEEYK